MVRQLPEDGVWARFHANEKWQGGTESVWQFEISLVGRKMVNGEKCRWIELKLKSDGSKAWQVFKWLVAEKQLRVGGTALADAHESWRKTGPNQARQINLTKLFARLHLFAPPPLKDAKKTFVS